MRVDAEIYMPVCCYTLRALASSRLLPVGGGRQLACAPRFQSGNLVLDANANLEKVLMQSNNIRYKVYISKTRSAGISRIAQDVKVAINVLFLREMVLKVTPQPLILG
jgi:hypothetical protein